jgi:hypothetical protein
MALVKGLKVANSKYFCLFCKYPKDSCGNLNLQWKISENKKDIFLIILSIYKTEFDKREGEINFITNTVRS